MIHSTAIIDPDAKIGTDVKIGAYSIINKATIGDNTTIAPHAVIGDNTIIGKNNKIYEFACIGGEPQDLKYQGEPTYLEIGNNNIMREYSTMNRGTIDGNSKTIVGNNNLFMEYTHVAHDCVVKNNVVLSNSSAIAGHVTVDNFATIGGFSAIHQFSAIGKYAFIGFSSAVNRNIPPFIKVAGNHAKALGINKVGLQRHGFSNETIKNLHKFYLKYIKSRAPVAERYQAISQIIQKCPDAADLYEFIKTSNRPIVR